MPNIRENLAEAWLEVKAVYEDERINGERALQSSLYCALSKTLPSAHDYVIFVEPYVHGTSFQPDMIVVNRNPNIMKVELFLELKCSPHWWFTENFIKYDLDKLEKYAGLSEVEIDVYGPNRILTNTGQWDPPRPKYRVFSETLFGMAIVARENDIFNRSMLQHDVAKNPQFILLTGTTDPDKERMFIIK